MRLIRLLYIYLLGQVYLALVVAIEENSCTQLSDACSCRLQKSGKIISLKEIDGIDEARFKGIYSSNRNYVFDYNPCTPFTIGEPKKDQSCYKTLVCQHDGSKMFSAGDPATFSASVYGGHVVFQYAHFEGSRNKLDTSITLLCDVDAVEPKISNVTIVETMFKFNLTTKCACPNGCVSSSNKHLSTGSLLVILFFVCVLVYFVGGFLFLKFYKKNEGTDAIPNYEFWKDVPAKIKVKLTQKEENKYFQEHF